MDHAQHNKIVSFIWGIADDVLRDVLVRGKYRDAILPMVVIRRLDVLLEGTDQEVRDTKKLLDENEIMDQEGALCAASGHPFYNTSKFTLKSLLNTGKKQKLRSDLMEYLDGFSPNVQEILEKFDFRNLLQKLQNAGSLYPLIEKFVDPNVNLGPDPILDGEGNEKHPGLDNHSMGTVFEHLIRKFNEENNEEAGEHWTPRDVVDLMANLIFLPIADEIESSSYLVYDAACGTGGMLTVADQKLTELASERGKEVSIHLHGQEINAETYAICKADLLLKGEGEEAANIVFGSTLGSDGYRLPVVALSLLALTVWLSFSGSTRDVKTVEDKSNNQFVAKLAAFSSTERESLKSSGFAGSQAHIDLVANETGELEDTAWNAIVERMSSVSEVGGKGRTMVVVTCPGGGIHAAAWSSCVLDGLCDEYVEFKGSLGVVSGVSGGSVGTLMFVSSRYENELTGRIMVEVSMRSNEEIHDKLKETSPALDLATRSSLEQIAYGITTDDLYGSVWTKLAQSGRGQRLEDSFSTRLPEQNRDLAMGEWGDRAITGTVPIVIFNSTDAVTGRRVLFDTIPTPRRASSVGQTSRPLNYRELMEVAKDDSARDVKPATAARTSATFPYVSPFTKPDQASDVGNAVAICDGGYVDNEGIVTAVNWIEFMLKRWSALPPKERPFDRILLLRIEPAPTTDLGTVPHAGGFFGWLRWIFGPAETIIDVRSASQLERGNLESDLAELYLQLNTGSDSADDKLSVAKQRVRMLLGSKQIVDDKPRVQGAFRPTPNSEMSESAASDSGNLPVIVEMIRFQNKGSVVPLNWKLSKAQKQWYIESWKNVKNEDSSLNSTLKRFFTPTK